MIFLKDSFANGVIDISRDFCLEKLSGFVLVDFIEKGLKSSNKKEFFKEKERIQKLLINGDVGKSLMKDSGGLILCKKSDYNSGVGRAINEFLAGIDGDWGVSVGDVDFDKDFKLVFYLLNYWHSNKIKSYIDKTLRVWQKDCSNSISFKTVKYGRYLRPVYYFIEENRNTGWCSIFQIKVVWNQASEKFVLETKSIRGKPDNSRVSNYKDSDKRFICDNKILGSHNVLFEKNPNAMTYTQSRSSGIVRLDRLNCLMLFKKGISEALHIDAFDTLTLDNKDWFNSDNSIPMISVSPETIGIRFGFSDKILKTSIDDSRFADIALVLCRSGLACVNNYIDECNLKMDGKYKWPNIVEDNDSPDCLYVTSREETRSDNFLDGKFEFSGGFNQTWILDVTPEMLRVIEMTEEERQSYISSKDGSKQHRLFVSLFEFTRRFIEYDLMSLVGVKEAHGAFTLNELFPNTEEREKEWAVLMHKITESDTKKALRISLGSGGVRGKLKFESRFAKSGTIIDSFTGDASQIDSVIKYIVGSAGLQVHQVGSELLTPMDDHNHHTSTKKKFEDDSISRVSGYTIKEIGRGAYKVWIFFPSMFLGGTEGGRWNKARLFKTFVIKGQGAIEYQSVDILARQLLAISQYYPKKFKAGSCAQRLVFDYSVKNTVKQRLRND